MGLDMFLDYRRIADSIPEKPALNEHMYWRKANAIHKFFIDTCADGVDECQPIQVSIDDLADLVWRCETILISGPNADGQSIDKTLAHDLLPTHSGFFFGSTDYDEWYIEDLKKTVKALKPIVNHPELYPGPFIYQASW